MILKIMKVIVLYSAIFGILLFISGTAFNLFWKNNGEDSDSEELGKE